MPLEIEVGASTAQLSKNMSELKSDLSNFKTQLEKATDTQTIAKLNKAIKETESSLKAIKGFDGGKIAAGSNQAGNALTNLGRIASDAPFGFIAIQNNLDPLIQSFGFLTRETGSTKEALKALGSSLTGTAGVALAFTLVTSAITFIIQKYGSLGEAIDSLTSDNGNLAQANRDMAQSFAQAEGKAAGEIAQIKALVEVATNSNLSRKTQGEAINKLNQEYDKYLPKLTLENIGTKAVQESIDKLTSSLIRQAKITGLKDLISKETAKQAEIFTKSLSGSADVLDNIVALAKSLKTGGNFFTEQTIAGAETAGKSFQEAQEKIDLFAKSLVDLTTDEAEAGTLFVKTAKAVDLLKQRIAALKEIQGTVGLDFAQRGELTSLEIRLAKRDDVIKAGFTKDELKDKIDFILQKYVPKTDLEVSVLLKPAFFTKDAKIDIAKAIGLGDTITAPAMTILPGKIRIDPFAEAIGNAFADSLNTLSESIGKAFASGDFATGLQEAAKGILSILGDTLIGIGKQLIITSALVKAVKAALNGIFGVGGSAAALAVGVGLVAFGGLLKNIDFSGPKLADGGITTGSTLANIGEAGTEVVAPLTKLPYLMNQAGGNSGGGMVVGLRVKGRELLAMLEREKSFANRLG
jgi:hypothetical protein